MQCCNLAMVRWHAHTLKPCCRGGLVKILQNLSIVATIGENFGLYRGVFSFPGWTALKDHFWGSCSVLNSGVALVRDSTIVVGGADWMSAGSPPP